MTSFLIAKIFVETPRFLVSKQRFKKARMILEYISSFNLREEFKFHLNEEIQAYNNQMTRIIFTKNNEGNQINNSTENILKSETLDQQLQNKNKMIVKTRYNILDLFKYKSIRYYAILQFLQWFMRYFVYYTITFSIEQYGNSINFNFSILGFAEVVAAFITSKVPLEALLSLPQSALSPFLFAQQSTC